MPQIDRGDGREDMREGMVLGELSDRDDEIEEEEEVRRGEDRMRRRRRRRERK